MAVIDYASQIKEAVAVDEACRRYGINVDRGGYTPCLFHKEKTGSMKVQEKMFHCYGCGAHGDVIDLTMQLFGLSFRDAMKKLNADFKLGLPLGEKLTAAQIREAEEKTKDRLRARNERKRQIREAEKRYHTALKAWIRNDIILMSGNCNDEYYDAIRKKEWVDYELDTALILLYEAERRI